ncbi:MAG: type VI secretion system lipoprotein TssJ [Cellvibrionaceae bacterium]
MPISNLSPHRAISKSFARLLFTSTLLITSLIVLMGCTAPNYVWPAYDKITLFANKTVNPDDNNRPSPIQVKIYELAARTTFDNLDFQSLFNNGSTLLSDELISEETFVIQPNETLSHKIELNKTATHVAIVAAYRKIDGARWKHIYPIKFYGYYKHAIELTSNGIIVQQSERSAESEDTKKNTTAKDPHPSSDTEQKPNSSEFEKTLDNEKIDKNKRIESSILST